jgi:hypothetical protein
VWGKKEENQVGSFDGPKGKLFELAAKKGKFRGRAQNRRTVSAGTVRDPVGPPFRCFRCFCFDFVLFWLDLSLFFRLSGSSRGYKSDSRLVRIWTGASRN